jgi:hypothetical protein
MKIRITLITPAPAFLHSHRTENAVTGFHIMGFHVRVLGGIAAANKATDQDFYFIHREFGEISFAD